MTSNRPAHQNPPEEQFEEHLRGFRPVPPRTLVIPQRRTPRRAMAVAAGLVLAAGISFLARHQQQATIPPTFASAPVTLGTLNAALRDSDETLNRVLDDASPHILARGQQGTVLYELGKE